MKSKNYVIIMAGGRGERFWPVGRKKRPKQLLNFFSDQTLIETTVQRLFPMFLPENIFVFTNHDYVDSIQQLLPIPIENVIGEPAARDTAACVALAAAWIKRLSPHENPNLIFLPADHLITPTKIFQDDLTIALEEAQKERIVLLGIPPTYPATGYGYILVKEPTSQEGVHHVLAFCEKPELKRAELMAISGVHFWNAGIFVWSLKTIFNAFEKHAPDLFSFIQSAIQTEHFEMYVNTQFPLLRKISIDYAIMEKADNISLVPARYSWNDVGAWDALKGILPQDEHGNIFKGKHAHIECENCIVINEDTSMLLSLIGLKDIAVIHSNGATLVCPISELQKVKKLLANISSNPENQHLL